ncbi:15352_t:CDS:2, partial [Racocetra persica]
SMLSLFQNSRFFTSGSTDSSQNISIVSLNLTTELLKTANNLNSTINLSILRKHTIEDNNKDHEIKRRKLFNN